MKRNLSVIFLRVISLILSFGFGVFLTRSLTIFDRGLYTEFITWSSIGSVLISFGLPVFILREGAKKRINALTINSIAIGFLLISIFSIFVLAYNSFSLSSFFIVLCSSFLFFITFYRHYALSKKKILLFEWLLILPTLISFTIAFILYLIDPDILNLYIWMTIFISGPIFYGFYIKFKFKFLKNNFHFVSVKGMKKVFQKATPFFIVSLGGIMFSKAPYAYLSLIGDTENLAFFGIAEIIPALFISVSASLVSINSLSIFSSKKDTHFKIIIQSITYIILLYVIGILICKYFGTFIITSIYGDEYHVSATILPVLFTTSFFIIVTNIIFNALISQNKTIYGIVPSLVICFFLMIIYIFDYKLDLNELAYSTLVLSIISLLFFCIMFFKMYRHNKNY